MSRPRSDYKICEYCGAAIDVGERCTCRDEEKPKYRKIEGCTYTYVYGCKGCKHNIVPELRDGGCRIALGMKEAEVKAI